jgi:septal ring factor EnvC (AmiA/AmiB activator)
MTPSAPPHAPPNLSDCERQLFALTAILKQTMTKLAQCRPEAKDSLQDPLESLAGEINKMKTLCFECEKLLSENARRSAFLLSRKADMSRQVSEARHFVAASLNSKQNMDEVGGLLASNPLDRDSEDRRRELAAKTIKVQKLLKIARDRIVLFNKISSTNPNDGHVALFQTLLRSFQNAKLFEEERSRTTHRISDLLKAKSHGDLLK